jgi:hypothetical protein
MVATAVAAPVSPARQRMAPVVVGAGAALACVVLAVVDPRSTGLPACPFRAATGLACPACGMTRGMHELLGGHPVGALRLNVLLAVVVPAMLYGYAVWALPRWTGHNVPTPSITARAVLIMLAVALLWGVVRNLPWGPLPAFSSLG